MKRKMAKTKYLILTSLIFSLLINNFAYAFWFNNEKEDLLMWVNEDGSFPKNTWYAIDEDGDEYYECVHCGNC